MHDPLLVSGLQCFGDLSSDSNRLVYRDRPARDELCERLTVNELQHECVNVRALLEAVNCGDVRVVERGDDLRFPLESGDALAIEREVAREHLERDVSMKCGVVRTVHLTHAAGSDQCPNLVGAEVASEQFTVHVWPRLSCRAVECAFFEKPVGRRCPREQSFDCVSQRRVSGAGFLEERGAGAIVHVDDRYADLFYLRPTLRIATRGVC